jgi:threonine/homoserine/homoserine lactone efflux protein
MSAIALALRVVVALYLCFLAVRLWRSGVAATGSGRAIRFRDVLVTTMLNPKALLFAFGIVPLHAPGAMLYLAAFVLMVIAAGSCWILLGIAVARGLLSTAATRLVPRFGAVAIAAFAGYLLLVPLWQRLAA